MANRKAPRCRDKTNRGNVYGNLLEAQLAGHGMSRMKRRNIRPYKCDFCGKYHLGRPHKYDTWLKGAGLEAAG